MADYPCVGLAMEQYITHLWMPCVHLDLRTTIYLYQDMQPSEEAADAAARKYCEEHKKK